ncbi:hypothetical protein [Actinoallomurus sp. CA-150999]|uniref:hypothetical protein n=1 Tax=Actinoallomurus sp. CA-150999 TaxID=3239887 RepID=UPI003D8BB1AC
MIKVAAAAVTAAATIGAHATPAKLAAWQELSTPIPDSSQGLNARGNDMPYRNWAELDNRAITITFSPNGDYFDVWYNRTVIPNRVNMFWRYTNSNIGHSSEYFHTLGHRRFDQWNIEEHRNIAFGVCGYDRCSGAVYYNG